MPPLPPSWVKALKPADPQGSELLQKERAQSISIDVERLAEHIHTRQLLDMRQRLLSIMEREKVFDKSQNHTLGRVDRLQRSLAKAKRLQQLREEHCWSEDEFKVANDLLGEPTPYGLHASMFLVSHIDDIRR
jgi:acyl-CoA oxidase